MSFKCCAAARAAAEKAAKQAQRALSLSDLFASFFVTLGLAGERMRREATAEPDSTVYDEDSGDEDSGDEGGGRDFSADPTIKRPFKKVFLFEVDGIRYFQSPCLRTLKIGKHNQGFWDSDHFLLQVEDVLDVMEIWFPGHEFLVEVDHSSGHDKFKPDGLNVNNMAANVGGKSQRLLRTSMSLVAESLGRHEAVVVRYSDSEAKGEKKKKKPKKRKVLGEWNVKLKVGDDQSMVFQEGDPPPFQHPGWAEKDYVGKAKGIDQVRCVVVVVVDVVFIVVVAVAVVVSCLVVVVAGVFGLGRRRRRAAVVRGQCH